MQGLGIRPVRGKSPPKVIDEHTTLDDLYDELPVPDSNSSIFTKLDCTESNADDEPNEQIMDDYRETLLNEKFLRKVRANYEQGTVQEEHVARKHPEKRTESIDRILTYVKQILFTEEELMWVNDLIEQDETGVDVISTEKLFRHFSLRKIGKETSARPAEASSVTSYDSKDKYSELSQDVQVRHFRTVRFVPWSDNDSSKRFASRFKTKLFTIVSRQNKRLNPTDSERSFQNNGEHPRSEDRRMLFQQEHHAIGRQPLKSHADGKSKEAGDRAHFMGFQTAGDALAEANARMGIKPPVKRQGLSKIMYNPPFARPEQAAKDECKHHSPQKKKAKTEEEASALEGLPSYLLNEDGTALLPRVASCEPKLLEAVCREIMDLQTKVAWDDIAGLKSAKDTLEEVIIWPLLRPDIFTGLRGPPKGILLFGPPGTGKTLLARAVASQTGCTFFNISSSSLMSKWIGDGEKMVRCLFAIASVKQPSVVFIDEIDSLLSARTEGEQDAVRRIKTEFLVQLDGAATENTDRVLVIGATNRPEELDEAARRRLERRLYIPLPDADSRGQIISRLLRAEANVLGEEGLLRIVDLTAGYSGADMKALCREAAMRPLRECRSLKSVTVNEVRPINVEDFEKAVRTIRPTVSDIEIQRYTDWNGKYGSASL
ncbi:hypothetical protein XU18_3478 [Perkinsela sp. CCAP 1560/4]|nr:hypothetical protein XU18_3478 [Perkinsela sp. CCAP 1560/4]|eukprot:KNH05507.1 hypothetical protein XU18_3478 [Perkinsela sp. CCAP 1560/4]